MIYTTQIPAVPYYAILRQYAAAHGLPFFTAAEQKLVIKSYEANIVKFN